jgi:hypothetical protein
MSSKIEIMTKEIKSNDESNVGMSHTNSGDDGNELIHDNDNESSGGSSTSPKFESSQQSSLLGTTSTPSTNFNFAPPTSGGFGSAPTTGGFGSASTTGGFGGEFVAVLPSNPPFLPDFGTVISKDEIKEEKTLISKDDTNFFLIKPILDMNTILTHPDYEKERKNYLSFYTGKFHIDDYILKVLNFHTKDHINTSSPINQLKNFNWDDSSTYSKFNIWKDFERGIAINQLLKKDDAVNGDVNSSTISNINDNDNKIFKMIVKNRFEVIKSLNISLSSSLPLIDIYKNKLEKRSIASLLSDNSKYILPLIKNSIINYMLSSTRRNTSCEHQLHLLRVNVANRILRGEVDNDGRWTCFGQAFRQLHAKPASSFRKSSSVWKVHFTSENSIDQGGPYRESFSCFSTELMSLSLPLLRPCPNSKNEIGSNREMWVLNPDANNKEQLQMFAWFGKLIGISIVTKQYLELNLASIVWKIIVEDKITLNDIRDIDEFSCNWLDEVRNKGSDWDDNYFDALDLSFTKSSLGNTEVSLHRFGENVQLKSSNRLKYCTELENYMLTEMNNVASAVRFGLITIIPLPILRLISGEELELLSCGNKVMDINLLESICCYSGCSSNDTHIVYFWEVMREITEEDRAAVIKFIWGRSRLPLTKDGFSRNFNIQRLTSRYSADLLLPLAHTCFFQLDLPFYTSKEILRTKLLYAVYNCTVIDGDGQNVSSNFIGDE